MSEDFSELIKLLKESRERLERSTEELHQALVSRGFVKENNQSNN